MGYKYRRTLPSEPLFLTKGRQKYYPALSPEFLQCLTPEMSVSLTKENSSTEGSYFAHLRRSLSPCTRGISQSENQEYLVSIRLHRTPKMNVGANSHIHRVGILRMFIAHCFRIARDRSRHFLNPSVRYIRWERMECKTIQEKWYRLGEDPGPANP